MPTLLEGPIGYTLLFVLMVFEGPIVSSAAAVGVHLGYFTLPAVFGLAVLGDLVGDLIYYGVGIGSRRALLDQHGHKFGLDHERLSRLDAAFHRHRIKSLVLAKVAPALPGPVLIAAGVLRVRLRTLLGVSLSIAVPKYLFFVLLGYELGGVYESFFKYYDVVGWIMIAVMIVGSYFIARWFMKVIIKDGPE